MPSREPCGAWEEFGPLAVRMDLGAPGSLLVGVHQEGGYFISDGYGGFPRFDTFLEAQLAAEDHAFARLIADAPRLLREVKRLRGFLGAAAVEEGSPGNRPLDFEGRARAMMLEAHPREFLANELAWHESRRAALSGEEAERG